MFLTKRLFQQSPQFTNNAPIHSFNATIPQFARSNFSAKHFSSKTSVAANPNTAAPLIAKNAFSFTYPHLENPQSHPRLPIPPLSQTLSQYLFYLKPLLSQEEYEKTETLVSRFQEDGDAKALQRDLQKLDEESKTSWLEGLWDSMYLDLRCPLPINVSPFIILHDWKDSNASLDPQIGRAANLIGSVARFHLMIQNGTLPQDRVGKNELDMSQYRTLFGTARIPVKGRDTMLKYPEAKHVVVISNGHYFKLSVLNQDDKIVSQSEMQTLLTQIREDSLKSADPEPQIGAMTSEDRDIWAEVRQKLLPHNRDTFDAIDSALTVLVLDQEEPVTLSELSRQVFHGAQNRWYDKTQFIVTKSGKSGINMEHTAYDGHTLLTFVHFNRNVDKENDVQTESSEGEGQYEQLSWTIPEESQTSMMSDIVNATEKHNAIASALDSSMVYFKEFGAQKIKGCKVSPDAFVQMAYQLAFYRISGGKTVSTYESANTKFFFHGRTETVRSASPSSRVFTEIFDSQLASTEQKIAAFREACEQHVQTLKKCQSGQGVDRHLFGLNKLSQQRQQLFSGYEIPEIFTDKNFTMFGSNILSTSNVSTPDMQVFGFGPVHMDGFGIGYSMTANDMVFYVTNYEGRSELFMDAIAKALRDIYNLFE